MTKKRAWLHVLSVAVVVIPNLIYMLCNIQVLKDANWLSLTMTALLVLGVIGLGALAHFKPKAGIWVVLIGVFVLALANMSYVAGIALIIEGVGLALESYLIRPIIKEEKIKELKARGETVTYTSEVK